MALLPMLFMALLAAASGDSIVTDKDLHAKSDEYINGLCAEFGEASTTCDSAKKVADQVHQLPMKIAVVGMSGGGKSTTTNTLAGISPKEVNRKDAKGRLTGALVCNSGRACTGEVEGGEMRVEGYTIEGTEHIRIFDLAGCGTEVTPLWATTYSCSCGNQLTSDCNKYEKDLKKGCETSADVEGCMMRGREHHKEKGHCCDYWTRFNLECGYDVYVLVLDQKRRFFDYECDAQLIKWIQKSGKFYYILFNYINVYMDNFDDEDEDVGPVDHTNVEEIERRMDSFMYSVGCPSNGTGVYKPDGVSNSMPLDKGDQKDDTKIKGLTRNRVFGIDARWRSRKHYEMLRFKEQLIQDLAMLQQQRIVQHIAESNKGADTDADLTILLAVGTGALVSGFAVVPGTDIAINMCVTAAMISTMANIYNIKWSALAVDVGVGIPLQAGAAGALQIALMLASQKATQNALIQGAGLMNIFTPGAGQAAKIAFSAYAMHSTGKMAKQLMTSSAAERKEMLDGLPQLPEEYIARLPMIDCMMKKMSAAILADIKVSDATKAMYTECWKTGGTDDGDKVEL